MAGEDVQYTFLGETTCCSLLLQLQKIWDEVGESDVERDKMLFQLELECLNVYKRKVDQAAKSKAHLIQALADAKHEFSTLLASFGEKSVVAFPASGTIKELLAAISPDLERLRTQKEERIRQFIDVQTQIQKICVEISGSNSLAQSFKVDESDLSLKKLKEFRDRLQELQKEKSQRLTKVHEFVNILHDICSVLGIDFYSTAKDVHPSLTDATCAQSRSISNDTLSRLEKTVIDLKEVKQQRLHKHQDLTARLTELWNLMDTSEEERKLFDYVTCYISASVDDVTAPGALALYLIEQAEVEIERLDQLKAGGKPLTAEELMVNAKETIDAALLHLINHLSEDVLPTLPGLGKKAVGDIKKCRPINTVEHLRKSLALSYAHGPSVVQVNNMLVKVVTHLYKVIN